MFNRFFLTLLLIVGLAISVSSAKAQSTKSNKSTKASMDESKTITIPLVPIKISDDLSSTIAFANKDLELASRQIELAKSRKDNVILQLRLLLSVPNPYIYNESTLSFDPPKAEVKKEEKKIDLDKEE